MADKFPFISAFICERVLQEQDGTVSAIRIVDIFNVPETTPEGAVIQFWAVAMFKIAPVEEREYEVSISILRPSGEREILPPPDQKVKPVPYEGDSSIPAGISVVVRVNVKLKTTGTTPTSTSIVEISLDGEVAARIPFTIRRIPNSALQ